MMDSTPYEPIPSTSKSSSSSTKNLISSISTIPHSQLDTDTCSLLGPFSILIQAIMALIILISLLYKRHREKPKRKYRIWTADVSKQVLGQAFVHMLNIFISDSMASLPSKGNPCALYFINIFIDTTIGVFVLFLALNSLTKLVCKVLESSPASLGLSSGIYPRPFLMSWLKQISIYFVGLLILKLFVIGLFWLGGEALIKFGNGIIEGISHDPKVQILMVVMIGPTILNVLQFLLIDSFIKHKPTHPIEQFESDDGRRFLNDGNSDSESDDQDHEEDDDHETGRKSSGLPTNGDQDQVVRKKKDHAQDPNSSRNQRSRLSNPTNLHGSVSAVVADVSHSYPPRTPQPETRERNQPGYSRFGLSNHSLKANQRILSPLRPLAANDDDDDDDDDDDPNHFLSDQPTVQHPFKINSDLASNPTSGIKSREILSVLTFDENPKDRDHGSIGRSTTPSTIQSSKAFDGEPHDRKTKGSNRSSHPPPPPRNKHYHHHHPTLSTHPPCPSPTEMKTGFSALDFHPSSSSSSSAAARPSAHPLHHHHQHHHHPINPSICL